MAFRRCDGRGRAGGLGLGDDLTLYRLEFDSNGGTRAVAYPFTVVGLTAANALPGYDLSVPHAHISWDEAAAVDDPLGPTTVTLHWAVAPVAITAAVLAAVIVASVLAFWAS